MQETKQDSAESREAGRGALVVLSGGQDSTTCLYWALHRFGDVAALTFNYGQRHQVEVAAAADICDMATVEHIIFDMLDFGSLVQSSLTRMAMEVKPVGGPKGLPNTFTPGRNIVFLAVAMSVASSMGWKDIVTGVCQTDYSGYPDCRRAAIDALEGTLRLGMDDDDLRIHTPLMDMTKKETVMLAASIPGCWDALALTVTCYNGKRPGCGECPACELRAKGFKEAALADPAT